MAPLSGTTSSARQSATSAHAAASSCSSRRASLGIRGPAASAAGAPWLWLSIATIVAKLPPLLPLRARLNLRRNRREMGICSSSSFVDFFPIPNLIYFFPHGSDRSESRFREA
uniref:Uncharacterized protein n=1 Tax=Arundo donax TaxID=35708 RepID=A0A0A9D151_ARUDO